MATIGVLVPCSPGHMNPMGSLGRELLRRGHRVVVAQIPEGEPAIRAAGLEFVAIGEREYPDGALGRIHEQLGRLQGRAALKFTLDGMAGYSRMILTYAPDAFRTVGADLLVVDQAVAGGGVADVLGLPFVTVANALMFNVETTLPPPVTTWTDFLSPWGRLRNDLSWRALDRITRPLRQAVSDQRQAMGLPVHPSPDASYSTLAQISQQPPEFEFPRRTLPAHFHFAGPFQDPAARTAVPFPFDRLDGRPLVYASMGTLQNRLLRVFRTIAEACAGLEVQLVISLGGSADPSVLGPLPGSPIVVRVAPQLDLLARASLTITHAGLNTALESLARGVPMVAIPITNDQPGVAGRVSWTGAGLTIPPRRLTAPRLRRAVSRVLTEPSVSIHAERLRDAIARCGGVVRAADVIDRVLATGRPVLASDFADGPARGPSRRAGGVSPLSPINN